MKAVYGAFIALAGEGLGKDISITAIIPARTQIKEVIPRIRQEYLF